MKEYRIEIEETIFLEHEVIIELPEELFVLDILRYMENECQNKSEMSEYIKKIGGKSLNFIKSDSGYNGFMVRGCKEIKKEKK